MLKLVRLRSRTHTSWIISCLRQRFCVEIASGLEHPNWLLDTILLLPKLTVIMLTTCYLIYYWKMLSCIIGKLISTPYLLLKGHGRQQWTPYATGCNSNNISPHASYNCNDTSGFSSHTQAVSMGQKDKDTWFFPRFRPELQPLSAMDGQTLTLNQMCFNWVSGLIYGILYQKRPSR